MQVQLWSRKQRRWMAVKVGGPPAVNNAALNAPNLVNLARPRDGPLMGGWARQGRQWNTLDTLRADAAAQRRWI
jgi:hypothetical protein